MINNFFNIAGGRGSKHHIFYFSFEEVLKEDKTLEEPLMFINTHLRGELLKCRNFIKTVYLSSFRLQTAE